MEKGNSRENTSISFSHAKMWDSKEGAMSMRINRA
jgi:hypothetical protein